MKRLFWRSAAVLGMGLAALLTPSDSSAFFACGHFCVAGQGQCDLDLIKDNCPSLCGGAYNSGMCADEHEECDPGTVWLMCTIGGPG